VTLKTRQWQSSVFEWIRQTVPRDSSNTNRRTSRHTTTGRVEMLTFWPVQLWLGSRQANVDQFMSNQD